ncbi:hypothetical protein AJ80_08323 [Polytolypa hystricis UAMH7299]|uniref:Uncharacterized protein n=1 Tax=Polytolypa hystricis (strain UAMH7299) TaxID=1447883 RepID=A0A2B7X9U7_POLH7|nr:hypothetical protein AJ80_08323 [Polytolypa hystricis UAMH7299]
MKDWIQEHSNGQEDPTYDTLQGLVNQAWEAVDERILTKLIQEMPERCQAKLLVESVLVTNPALGPGQWNKVAKLPCFTAFLANLHASVGWGGWAG